MPTYLPICRQASGHNLSFTILLCRSFCSSQLVSHHIEIRQRVVTYLRLERELMLWKAENPFWSQPFTERSLVTPANRESKYHPVCKALLCMNHIRSRSWDALLLDDKNRHATAGSPHAKLQVSLSLNSHLHLASLLSSIFFLTQESATCITSPWSNQILWNTVFHSVCEICMCYKTRSRILKNQYCSDHTIPCYTKKYWRSTGVKIFWPSETRS